MNASRIIIGLAFIVFGALALVEAMGYIHLDWSWLSHWDKYIVPVILLLIGAKIIGSSGHCQNTQCQQAEIREFTKEEGNNNLSAQIAFSGSQYKMAGKEFPGADMNIFMGGATLDLRGANIQDGAVINVRTFMGGLELWTSPDIRIEVHSSCFAGGVGNHAMSATNPDAKTVILNASCFFGGVDIKG